MKSIKFKVLPAWIVLIFCILTAFAQSDEKENKISADEKNSEQVEFILAVNFASYINELNKFGKLGFRVEKAFNYGGDLANSQKFAAVLRRDSKETFAYDWLTSPNKDFLESRLNSKAEQGFYVTHILPVTVCSDLVKNSENDSIKFPVSDALLRLTKGDIFLLERRVGDSEKQKEYKVFTGEIGPGKSPATDLQKALDSAPAGFQPFKILFNKAGFLDLSVSVLLEKDLKNTNSEKIEYKFFKDVNGFEKEFNSLAKNGFQLIAGRRIGLIKFVLLAKASGDAISYIFLDADKFQREFDKKVAPVDVYKGMFLGDTTCGENEIKGGKLVFAQNSGNGEKRQYKFFKLTEKNKLPTDDTIVSELKKLLAEGFSIRDIFYSDGANVILEK
jgi:hypothetical protein